MSDISDLLDRLWKAEPKDFTQLDADIYALLREHHAKYQDTWPASRNPPLPDQPLPYTSDFEAAMSLIPQEDTDAVVWLPQISFCDNRAFPKSWWVDLNSAIRGAVGDDICHPHLPVAICMAAIEARASTLIDGSKLKEGDVIVPYRRQWTSDAPANPAPGKARA